MNGNPFETLIPKKEISKDNPFASLVQEQKPTSDVKGGFIGEILTGNTQRFSKTAGEALASKENTEKYANVLQSHTDIQNNLLKTIRTKKELGQDTTKLEEVLKDHISSTPKQEEFTGDVINKTTGQIAGEALGTAIEATGVGAIKGIKGIGLVKNVAETAKKAETARKAFQGLSLGKKALSIGKDTARIGIASVPFGYGYDVSAGLQGQRGEDKTGAGAFKPGLATALSGAIPVGVGVLRFGKTLADKTLPHILSNLSGEPLEAYQRRQTGQLKPFIKEASKEKTLNIARDAVTKFRVGMIEEFGNSIENVTQKYQGTRIGFDDINAKKLKDVAEAFGFDMPQNVKNMSGKEVVETLTNLSEAYIPNASTLADIKMNNAVKALSNNLKTKGIAAFGGKEGEFAKMYKNYATKSDLYKEIAGVVGKVGQRTTAQTNAARNRLTNIFNENSSAYLDAVKKFEKETGAKILDQVAAARLNPILPKTLRGAPTGVIGWASDLISLITIPLSSPRIGSGLIRLLSGADEILVSNLLDKVPGARKAIYNAVTKENMSFNDAVKKYVKNPKIGLGIKDVSGQSSRSPVKAWSTPMTKAVPTTNTKIQPKNANISKTLSPLGEKIKTTGEVKPTLKLKRNVQITTLSGEKTIIPEDEVLKAYESGGKALLKDGREYIVSKSQYENIKNNSLKSEAKEFAPELKTTEETILGGNDKTSKEYLKIEKQRQEETAQEMFGDSYDNIEMNERIQVNDLLGGQITPYENLPSTKFSQYQLPEGKNYKEILIKAPTEKPSGIATAEYAEKLRQGTFKSSHWDEPNVISHLRLNERTYKGKKVTFMEEMQSDWAREGRSKGFSDSITKDTAKNQGFTVYKAKNNQGTESYFIDNPKDEYYYRKGFGAQGYDTEGEAWNRILTGLKDGSIPNHPLLKNWQELSVKRALKEAVDNNSEYLAWISGEQTSARYNLATQVDNVNWEKGGINNAARTIEITPKNEGSKIRVFIDDKGIVQGGANTHRDWKGKKLDEVLGKGLADKIMEKETGTLSGEGLHFGGEWAKNLYDKQVKNIVEDLTGKKVEVIDMGLPIENSKNSVKWLTRDKPSDNGLRVIDPKKDIKVGREISQNHGENNFTHYIITDILGDGKFKAVPKNTIEIVKKQKRVQKDGTDVITDKDALRWLRENNSVAQESFDISTKKSTGQQAIFLSEDIKRMVRGESPKLK